MDLHERLVHAVTAFDAKMSANPKAQQSIYALGHYLKRIEEIEADIAKGASPRAAIIAGMSGQLCNAVLRGIGEKGITKEESDSKFGRVTC
jgi:hypothetical protein